MREVLGIFSGDDFVDCARLRCDADTLIFLSGERIYLTPALTEVQGLDLSPVNRAVLDFIENADGGAERLVGIRDRDDDVASAVLAVVRDACERAGVDFINLTQTDLDGARGWAFENGGRWVTGADFKVRVLSSKEDNPARARFWRPTLYGVLAALSNPHREVYRGGPKR